MDQPHIYDLTYVPSQKKKGTKATFVFSFKTEHMPELRKRLIQVLRHHRASTDEYLEAPDTFALGDADLFGHAEFGFHRCGWVDQEEGTTHLHVEVQKGDALRFTALTLYMLFCALYSPLGDKAASNRLQLLDISTHCVNGKPYGHAIMGHVSSTVFRALVQRTAQTGEEALPERVIRAMKNAWIAGGGKDLLAKHCGGKISEDGLFILGFTDSSACDVAIYPDNVYDKSGEHGVALSCHNLDTALQQVTLLAGLATLARAVEEEDW